MNFKDYFDDITKAVAAVDLTMLEQASSLIHASSLRGGKIILVGNGASSAVASHVAVDLTKTAGIRAVNFNETDLITCLANDHGYAHWVEKALDFYADPKDLVILISSSGMSPNIINAASYAKTKELPLITFSGFSANNDLRKMGKINFWVNSDRYNIVETVHQTWLLALVDKLAEQRKK